VLATDRHEARDALAIPHAGKPALEPGATLVQRDIRERRAKTGRVVEERD